MTDVTTMSILVNVKDDVSKGMNRIKQVVDQQIQKMSASAGQPVMEVERKLLAIIPAVEKIGRAAQSNRFVSDSALKQLDQASTYIRSLGNEVISLQAKGHYVDGLLAKFRTLQATISNAHSMAINVPGSTYMRPATNMSTADILQTVRVQQFLAGSANPLRLIHGDQNLEADRLRDISMLANGGKEYIQTWKNNLKERDAKEAEIRAINDARLASNMAYNRQADAYTRSMNPYGVPSNSATLSPAVGTYARQDQEAADRLARNMAHNRMADAFNRNMNPYGPTRQAVTLSPAAQAANVADLREHAGDRQNRRKQADIDMLVESKHVEQLRNKYAALNEEKLKELKISIDARHASGQNVTSQLHAYNEVVNPWSSFNRNDPGRRMKMGMGSGMHAFRYGSQNAAFALEDYLISSQYGGPAAGLRAVTNNLTAIAAASTMSMNPIASAGIIGGTALLGAAAPLVYNLSQDRTGSADQQQSRSQLMQDAFREQSRRYQEVQRSIIDAGRSNYQSHRSLYKTLSREFGDKSVEYDEYKAEVESKREQYNSGRTGWFNGEERKKAYNEILDMQAKLAAMGRGVESTRHSMDNAQHAMSKSLDFIDRDRKAANEFEDSLSPIRSQQRRGINVDPTAEYNKQKEFLEKQRDRAIEEAHYDKAEKRRIEGEHVDRMGNLDREFKVKKEIFQERKQEHEWDMQDRSAGWRENSKREMEYSPVEAINDKYNTEVERLQADQTLSQAEFSRLVGIADAKRKRAIENENQMPTLGSAIDVGSGSDVALRQQYFNRNETGSKQAEQESMKKLEDIVTEIRNLRQDLKGSSRTKSKI